MGARVSKLSPCLWDQHLQRRTKQMYSIPFRCSLERDFPELSFQPMIICQRKRKVLKDFSEHDQLTYLRYGIQKHFPREKQTRSFSNICKKTTLSQHYFRADLKKVHLKKMGYDSRGITFSIAQFATPSWNITVEGKDEDKTRVCFFYFLSI